MQPYPETHFIHRRCSSCGELMVRTSYLKRHGPHPENENLTADKHEWQCGHCGHADTTYSVSTKQECFYQGCHEQAKVDLHGPAGLHSKICEAHAEQMFTPEWVKDAKRQEATS